LFGIARQLGLGHISEDGRHRFGNYLSQSPNDVEPG
jgi:hypothetical protein